VEDLRAGFAPGTCSAAAGAAASAAIAATTSAIGFTPSYGGLRGDPAHGLGLHVYAVMALLDAVNERMRHLKDASSSDTNAADSSVDTQMGQVHGCTGNITLAAASSSDTTDSNLEMQSSSGSTTADQWEDVERCWQQASAAASNAMRHSNTLEECWHSFTSSKQLQSACEGFEQLGLLLCNQLPMPWLCNNTHCSNLSGVSELQLVGGKAYVCACCRVAR
jgi:hypothetical protein